jgi:hypothetical protein
MERIDGFSAWAFEIPLVKRFYVWRLEAEALASLSIQECSFDITETTYSMKNKSVGFSLGAGVSYPLTPFLRACTSLQWRPAAASSDWKYYRSGGTLQVTTPFNAELTQGGLEMRLGVAWAPPLVKLFSGQSQE